MAATHRWERVGAATGIAFVLLVVASIAVIPDVPPALDDPAAEIRGFYVDNKGGIQASVYLTGLAAFALIWFAASLRAALARVEGEQARLSAIVLGSAVATATLALVQASVSDVLAVRIAAEGEQGIIRGLYELQALCIAFAAFPLAAFVTAVSVSSLRTGYFPVWLTWSGYALTPGWLVAGFAVVVEKGFFSPTGAFGYIVFLAWLAWMLALSVTLVRKLGEGRSLP